MLSQADNYDINSSISTLATNANDESNPQTSDNALLNISMHAGDQSLCYCNELFFCSIQVFVHKYQ